MCLRASCVSSAAGFEGCSMVPSIYPLETLHNSLSLKQVNEFLTSVCESAGDPHTRTSRALSAMFGAHNQPSVDSYIPQRVLSTSISLRSRSDRPPWYSSGPSSAVSSAGPSSPTTADTSPRFSFSEKVPLTPQSSEETHSSQNISTQLPPAVGPQGLDLTCPAVSNPGEVPPAPKDPPEGDAGLSAVAENQTDNPELPPHGLEVALVTMDPSSGPVSDADHRPPCMALAELGLGRMEGYSLPGSLPVLLELRESSSEAGSSSQTPQSPEGPDEFFDTQESMDLWMDGPENTPLSETTAGYEAIQPADP
ncbi:inositol hexakisphosphate and diphosphoinositol-pentakisphosphate kinase 1 [Nematolebias whitei]|uniref:inositol hexakisphosphate and diphosphoinositol-pentakisphosphate kinase 1 n=1 Tax=Nematolebias whitei TaxID=451745 RepID=UPI00189836A2|nr:inositol hexakisphosphate and diphosphoinositol-pentakisphosphate kinase 1 [Nematolebias whitei]